MQYRLNVTLMARTNPPSTTATAFDCPHCGAFTTQSWFDVYARQVDGQQKIPIVLNDIPSEELESLAAGDAEVLERWKSQMERIKEGQPFVERQQYRSLDHALNNVFISRCYNCDNVAIWVQRSMVFPVVHAVGPEPNSDLPQDILHDIEEARKILNLSPRGAAALLRLSIQKLAFSLGEKGKNIDDDIASLVSKGLSPIVQRSLDIVRVVGNEAVHPGVIDLKDDRDTALQLLEIINVIAQQMISQPKMINDLYERLPEGKKNAIEVRNEKALRGALGKAPNDPPSTP